MTRIRVTSSIGDLATDLEGIAARVKPEMSAVVQRNVIQGNKIAQGIARKASGPHGKNYYKRLSSEALTPLSGEYGPTGDVEGRAVGAGWRHGRNTDLPKSADLIAPRFARDVGKAIDGWFW